LFVLIPEKRVRAYAAQQNEDIEPQINELLELAEKSLKILERKEAALAKKVTISVVKFFAFLCI
jgi:DASH complex subunit SPC19